MGKAISLSLEAKNQLNVMLLYGGIITIEAIKWLTEKPEQHVQWQKGEQSSCRELSF